MTVNDIYKYTDKVLTLHKPVQYVTSLPVENFLICVKIFQCHFLLQQPLQMDLVISLSQDGIKLIFDPVCQRLKVSE